MQYYIVTGGTGPWGYGSLRSSEILKKDGGWGAILADSGQSAFYKTFCAGSVAC